MQGANSTFHNRSVDPSHFAMIPRADIPRSVFRVESSHKTTFDANKLIPVYCQEVLPGDSFKVDMTAFVRMSTLIFPLMDNLQLCSFFFFVPNRLVWQHWQNFMGEQKPNPGSSTSYTIPIISKAAGYATGDLADYFGLPVQSASTGARAFTHSALPFRAYNLIYNEWFRDENLINGAYCPTDDGPDTAGNYTVLKRAKKHDYFTSCLPFLQKGTAASIPLTGTAPITGIGLNSLLYNFAGNGSYYESGGGAAVVYGATAGFTKEIITAGVVTGGASNNQGIGIQQDQSTGYPAIFANLSAATAVTINALRQSFQIQKLLERDARGGTRYTEILRAHFGVISPDARLQRPEYLGGGCSPVVVSPVAQTSVTGATPQGNLAGVASGVARHGFSKSFTEHGHILGIVNVCADVTYQQGINRMWSRSTRYDFYWPAFAHLGEQAVLAGEICSGDGVTPDSAVFGYQERYAEYRYKPSMVTGFFRSGITGTLDPWHLSQYFTATPSLNQAFIEQAAPISRVVAAGALANGLQFIFDSVFEQKMVRLMPTYSVPGFVDRF